MRMGIGKMHYVLPPKSMPVACSPCIVHTYVIDASESVLVLGARIYRFCRTIMVENFHVDYVGYPCEMCSISSMGATLALYKEE